MRDIPEGAPPTVVQMFNEGFFEFAEKEDSDAAAEPKRPPSAMRSQSSSGSRNSGVKTRSDARAEREESQSLVSERPKKRKPLHFCILFLPIGTDFDSFTLYSEDC